MFIVGVLVGLTISLAIWVFQHDFNQEAERDYYSGYIHGLEEGRKVARAEIEASLRHRKERKC